MPLKVNMKVIDMESLSDFNKIKTAYYDSRLQILASTIKRKVCLLPKQKIQIF